MKKYLLFVGLFGLLFSCEKPKNTEEIYKNAEGEITVGKNFLIEKPMAVLVLPTEASLEETRKEFGEEQYRIYFDDGASVMNEFNTVLEENKIETIDRLNNEIITFATKDGKLYDVNLTDKAFSAFLFNGKDEPKDLELEELSSEFIQNYMK